MEIIKKNIAILGSTGSISTQALEVIEQQQKYFQVEVLTANTNADLLIEQAKKHQPNAVVIVEVKEYKKVKEALSSLPIKVYAGADSLNQIVEIDSIDLVLTALVGFAGLKPTIKAIQAGKNIALANKETLVVAGKLIKELLQKNAVQIFPVDSEHSAMFQCIVGEYPNEIKNIILTASGGPFRGKTKEDLKKVTLKDALNHPNWDMGRKITIDSATLMNKGLEVIEAKWLFDVDAKQIDVVVHPQSVIHSAVEFKDGSIKAQLGYPSMKIPIQYALSYPDRYESKFKQFNFLDYPNLTFEKPDYKTFPNLQLAFEALKKGGNIPCALNAANEVVVEAFLNEQIKFSQIPILIETCLEKVNFVASPTLDDYLQTDKQTRQLTKELI